MGKLKFRATVQPFGPAAAVELTDDQVTKLGDGAKVFPVKATINGFTWRGRMARMGGKNVVGMNKEVRAAANAEAGDKVEVALELDTAPREVEVPPALAAAFKKDKAAKKLYDGLAFTHRKEFARWIDEAKKEETRDRRVAQALEMLHAGKTRS
jgi:hypothetical protein